MVIVPVTLLIVRSFVFVVSRTVSPPVVRTMAEVLIATAFAIFTALLIGGTVLFIGRVPRGFVGLRRG